MKDYTNEIVIAIIGSLTTLISYIQGKRRNNAEIDQIVVNSVTTVTTELKSIIEILKDDAEKSREHRIECENNIELIRKELLEIKNKCKNNCFS